MNTIINIMIITGLAASIWGVKTFFNTDFPHMTTRNTWVFTIVPHILSGLLFSLVTQTMTLAFFLAGTLLLVPIAILGFMFYALLSETKSRLVR